MTASGWADRHRGTRQQRGYGRVWELLRAQVLKRDCYLCQCDQCTRTGRTTQAHEVDHIRPKSKGGTDDISNLAAINSECHKRKTMLDEGHAPRVQIGLDGYPIV